MKISVISPTFNEAENVGPLVERLQSALARFDYEIIIADDNSPDRTWEKVEQIARISPRVRVLRRMQSPGLSPAVIDGFSAARGELVACIDADLQHDARILPQLIRALDNGAGVAMGSRYVEGGGVGDWNVLRRMESRFATRLAQVALGIRIADPMSGYFAMRRDDFLRVRPELNAQGFKILLEIIAKLKPRSIAEVPFTFQPRTAGESKLTGKVVFQYLAQLRRLARFRDRTSPVVEKHGAVA